MAKDKIVHVEARPLNEFTVYAPYTKRIRELQNGVVCTVLEIGAELLKAQTEKAQPGSGIFVDWIEVELGFKKSQAYRWMDVAKRFADFPKLGKSFSESALYVLAAPSAPVKAREAAIREAEAGGFITHAHALELIEEHRPGVVPIAALGEDGVAQANILLCDPPWRYEHVKTRSRAIENQYPTMSLDEIKAKADGVQKVTQTDAVLFIWATSPKLEECLEVIRAWEFSYRTCAVWDKEKIGMGYYFRQQHELLLVATKGSLPVPPAKARAASVFRSPRAKHSEKPECVYEFIEAAYPRLPKRELFARQHRKGWLPPWGYEA